MVGEVILARASENVVAMATGSVPAGPRGSLLMGSMREYNADPLAFMTDTARRYGDFVPLRLGPLRAVLLSNPRDIESVLVENAKSFHKSRGIHRLSTLLGNGIFIAEGEEWLGHRRLMQPAFHKSSVERYSGIMVRRTLQALDRWAAAVEIDVVLESRRLALEIAGEALFGDDVTEAEAVQIREDIEAAGQQLQTRVSSYKMFIPDWVPTSGNRRMNAAIERLDALVYRILEKRRTNRFETNDLLALLLAASDGESGSLSDRELRDEVITLLVAGHETTALTLAWALFEIARHPEVDARLAEEIKAALGDRAPTPADLHRLPFLSAIVDETLRLYPAGYLTARQAIADVEIGGRLVRKGTLVLMSQWEQHRDPAVFEKAADFEPARWTPELRAKLARGDFYPFGMGPRMCIGGTFANLELMTTIPMIRQRFSLRLVSREAPRPVPIVTLNPDRPIRMRVVASVQADSRRY
jgi:cytochrome P450